MNIVVCVKQVPETKSVKMDEKTGTVKREGVESIVNPLDLYAIEAALQLREKHGGKVTAVSMGPPQADIALREAVAMGVDAAVLISDRAFAGSDTWATGYAIGLAIKSLEPFDLIICGERATDGDTGQVGPALAAYLELPAATYVNRIDGVYDGCFRGGRLLENGTELLEMRLPGLITVVKEVSDPRLPTLRGKLKAKALEVPVLGLKDIDGDADKVGLKGSPTRVVKIFKPKVARDCQLEMAADEAQTAAAVDRLYSFLSAGAGGI